MFAVFVLFLGLSVFGLPVYNWVYPWPEAERELNELKPGNLKVCVGRNSEKKITNGVVTHDLQMRSYVLIPDVFKNPSVYAYYKIMGQENVLQTRPYNAIFIAIVAMVFLVLSYFVIKKMIIPSLTRQTAE